MATATWTTVLDHTSDAAFRAWGSELSSNLAAVGLVQTADTGQVNWTTVTRPNGTTDVYEMWRFDDTLQATTPLYLKVLYGTANSFTSNAKIGFQIGFGTNGSGAFTGYQNTIPAYVYTSQSTAGSVQSSTARTSYLCYSNGSFSLIHKVGGYGGGYTYFITISRTSDTSGNYTSNGVIKYSSSGSASRYSFLRHSSSIGSVSANNFTDTASSWQGCMVPGIYLYGTSTVTEQSTPNPRAFINYSHVPDVQPLIGVCTVNPNEVPAYSTFSTTLFGSTAHTYISHGRASGAVYGDPSSSTNFGIASIWE